MALGYNQNRYTLIKCVIKLHRTKVGMKGPMSHFADTSNTKLCESSC